MKTLTLSQMILLLEIRTGQNTPLSKEYMELHERELITTPGEDCKVTDKGELIIARMKYQTI